MFPVIVILLNWRESMNHPNREITIYYCGQEECAPEHYFGPAIRQHYLLHVVLDGKGFYRAGGETYHLEEGDAFLIKPQEITYYQADKENPWVYAWAAFGGGQAERLVSEYRQEEAGYHYRFDQESRWREWIHALVEAFEAPGHNQDEMAGYLYLLFAQFPRRWEGGEDPEWNYVAGAERYIHHNFSYPIQIGDVAKHVGIDRTYLFKLFKKYKGISPKQYLTACRLAEAKRLLEETALNATEIGLSCGFHDASVFGKNFQQWEGEPPLAYRKRKIIWKGGRHADSGKPGDHHPECSGDCGRDRQNR